MTFSENVTVSGTPELTLKIGTSDEDAEYARGSGTTKLVFEYDVTTGDEDTDGVGIEANKLSLPDGTVTIKDAFGNDATLTHSAVAASTSHKVDGNVPTISTVAITSDAGNDHTYVTGDKIQATATFSEKVTVDTTGGNTPQLTLEVGSDEKDASYTSGSGTTALVFEYTVASGDADADGIEIAANKLSPNNSTIRDKGGNDATLTHTAVAASTSHKVDTGAPTVSSVAITSTATNNYYKQNDIIEVTVTFSENVTVTDTPQLTLTVGSSDKTLAYERGSGTTKLLFDYAVASADEDTDGISVKADSLKLNSGTIKDAANNDATLTHTALTDQASHKVDTTQPTVSSLSITSTPTYNSTYKLGDTIQVTVTFSENVTVNYTSYIYTPSLKVTIGDQASHFYYTSGGDTSELVFEHTVATGDTDTDGIAIAANQLFLNGGTIQDAAGNTANLNHSLVAASTSHKVDTTKPTVSSLSITSTPTGTNTYVTGDTIQATVTFSEAMRVDTTNGTPKLTLEIGSEEEDAEYASGSTTTALVFEYTVVSGDVDTDGVAVEANTLDLNSGEITDLPGNPATLTHAAVAANVSHTVDATVPTVSSVAITSTANTNNYYELSDKIQATVTFSESVTVDTTGGTPQLTLKIGSADKTAAYTSGSPGTALLFEYTVANGDGDTDGVEIEKNQLVANGGTIKDSVGNAADLKHAALTPQTAHKVDGGIPGISTVTITSSPSSNKTYKAGEKIQVTVTFTENMTVTGTPQLTLSIGSDDKAANYKNGTGTKSLVFEYTVAAGDVDTDGLSIEANQLDLNRGTITDATAGNNARLTHTALTAQGDHKVDAVHPTIRTNGLRISSTPTSYNTYKEGNIVNATITFSEKVNVTGTPQLTLRIGSANKTALYTTGSGTANLVFAYTIAAGDEDTDGIGIEANQLSLPNGTVTIKDAGGNAATLTHAILTAQAAHKVDAIVPTVKNKGLAITSSGGADDIYAAGDDIEVTVTFTEKVRVDTGGGNNKPRLTLKIGTADGIAVYTGGSGTAKLLFEYTVVSGDEDTDGISVEANKLYLNKATITDLAGNDVASNPATKMVTHAALTTQIYHKVSAISPTINGIAITSSSGNNYYNQGATLQVTATFSETVTVTGDPTLGVTVGTSNKTARYMTGSGTAALVFEYTIASGDEDTDGVSIAANQLSRNGGTIRDAEGNAAEVAHAALPTQAAHKVDGIIPTVATDGIAITSTPTSDNTYQNAETIQVRVTFSESVTVTNTPRLKLRIGTSDKAADYKRGTGTKYLIFEYTVAEGDTDTDGIEIQANKLSLNNGTIADVGGNAATLTHAALTTQTTHKVNAASGPRQSDLTVSSVALSSTGPYGVGEDIEVTVTASEAVNVTGIPTVTLAIGSKDKTARYSRGSGTAEIVFGYTVVAGDTDTDGVAVRASSLTLNGGTLTNGSGNALALTHSGTTGGPLHIVDTTAPAVSANGLEVTSTSTNSYYKTDDTIEVTVTFSEIVNVTGTPILTLKIGTADENADYVGGTTTRELRFQYDSCRSGDADTDGISISANQLSFNGGTIKDTAGNAATLTHPALGRQTEHKVDGIAPTVAITNGITITSTPASNNTYKAGEKIQATVTFSENVKVTGTPTLTLSIGLPNIPLLPNSRTADYKSGSGTTALVFEYTVVNSDLDMDGISIATNKLSRNNGTIKDAAGNAANLDHTALTDQDSHKVRGNETIIRRGNDNPSVSSLTITSTGAPYGVDETIQVTVSFSESVTVTGTPTLKLSIGGANNKTAEYTSGNPGTALVFGYTVESGDADTDGISIAANQLSGTIKATVDEKDVVLTHDALAAPSAHTVDTTQPTVSTVAITSSPSQGTTYIIGEIIRATVTFSESVNVTGTPQLTLAIGNTSNAGKKANYASGTGTTALVFSYTVASGDTDTDGVSIEANSLALNNGTIKDLAGNGATLTHAAFPAEGEGGAQGMALAQGASGAGGFAMALGRAQVQATTHRVDGVSPSIGGVTITSTPNNNFYTTNNGNNTISFQVTFNEDVEVVSGTPHLTLTIGDKSKEALYKEYGKTDNTEDKAKLVFKYTVIAGDNDTNGISIQSLSGNIEDVAGNDANLTGVSLTDQPSHKVDTIVPNISRIEITSTPGYDSTYQAGETIQARVTFSESVTVNTTNGTPALNLKIGTGYRPAAYASGTGSTQLFFGYTVQSTDTDPNGISIDMNQLVLNEGTITDGAGNPAILTNTSLGTQSAHKVGQAANAPGGSDTLSPTVNSVALTSVGPYGIWDNITVQVTTTEAVTVTGSPSLAVIIGNKAKLASYQSGSGSASLVFQYTVSSADGDDPNGISVKANSLSGGTIKDTSDNTLDPNHPALPDQGPTHQVDTTAPAVSAVAFTSTGPYTVGSTVQVTVTTSEAITVTGSPSVTLVIGTTERTANYLSGTGSTALLFRYTITTADKDDTNGISLKTNSLKTNGGTLLDTAGNALKLTHGSVANSGEAQAVGVTVSGISALAFTSTGPYTIKDVVKITVTTAEKVTVTGTPRVAMVIGETLKYANYISGTGTTALVFHYTVVAQDSDPDGIEIPQNALEHYNGSTIKSHYQTALNLSHAGVAADTDHTVDTTQPVITSVTFAPDAPTVYTAGTTIEVIVTFAETGVKVTSDESGALPSLSLLFGSNTDPDSRKKAVAAPYKEARPGSTKLVFSYTVTAETPIDTDGVQIKDGSLRIPTGASIEDTSGNAVAATPGGDGSSLVGIKPASRLSSRPILPAVTSAGIIFNEFLNARTDKHDWIELRNTADTEMSLGGWKLSISVGNMTQTEVLEFPDMTVPAGTVLLLLNTGHKETHLENSQAYAYRYFKMPELRLRGSNFSLMLQDRSGAIVDVISNYATNTGTSGAAPGFKRDTAYFREQPTTPGYEAAAWQPSGYQGGLGYDRNAPKTMSLGTPGYLRNALTPKAQARVNISEIMFTTGISQKLPQWIELYNPSKTEVVTLQGWRLQLEIYDPSRQPSHQFVTLLFHKTLRILPNQTVLVVTKNGRNSQHFPEPRLYNLAEQNREKLEQFGLTAEFLNDLGYAIVLRDESGTQIDVAGNLDGESNTSDAPSWKLPNCITPVGYRTSIIRQYEKGAPLTGTHKSSWFRATEMRRHIVTYYGHPKDLGNPGWKKGGPLPVQLSSFKAERTEQGALIQWTTESELENAGFNVLRSETKTGPFQVVTPRMLQGAGTTSERSSYQYVDTTAKQNVAYYYRLEEVSFSGVQQPIATRRLRGHISAANRYLTTFGSLKKATW